MEAGYIIGLIIFVAVCWYIGAPLLQSSVVTSLRQEGIGKKVLDLALRKEEVMLTLKDLELDYGMQKISEPDYQKLYAEILHQGSELVQQIQTAKTTVTQSAATATVSAMKSTHKFCTQCGSGLVPGAKFCGECGHKVLS